MACVASVAVAVPQQFRINNGNQFNFDLLTSEINRELLLRKFQSLDSLKIKTLMEAIHMVSKVLMALIKLKQDIRQGRLRENMPIMTPQVD